MNNIIDNTQGLLEEYYITSDQSDEACFYVPDVNPNEAPIFRGQCETISGVQGFDIQRVSPSEFFYSYLFIYNDLKIWNLTLFYRLQNIIYNIDEWYLKKYLMLL